MSCSTEGSGSSGGGGSGESASQSPYVAYRWQSVCRADQADPSNDFECLAARSCPAPDEVRFELWGQRRSGTWSFVRTECHGGTPPEVLPTVTPGDVLAALRRVGLPSLETQVQPPDKTLVNLDTFFFTEPQSVDLDLTILQQPVDVVATPGGYLWDFGDGTSMTTSTPGQPYPSGTITHRYQTAGTTVSPHVEVTYTARFRVRGGAWQDIDGTVTTVGPPTPLRVAEATPLLSGQHR